MDSLAEIQLSIEKLRKELHELVEAKKGNLADPEVTRLSQKLDELIVRHDYQKAAEAEKRRS